MANRLEVHVDFGDHTFIFTNPQTTLIQEGVIQVLERDGDTHTFPLSQGHYAVLTEEQ